MCKAKQCVSECAHMHTKSVSLCRPLVGLQNEDEDIAKYSLFNHGNLDLLQL